MPSYIFYGTILSEIIRIARSTLHLDDLIPRLGTFFKRMLNQGADRQKILHQCKKALKKHTHSFEKFTSRFEHIIEKIILVLGWMINSIYMHLYILRIGGMSLILLGPPGMKRLYWFWKWPKQSPGNQLRRFSEWCIMKNLSIIVKH